MKILRVALLALLLICPPVGRAAVDFDFFYDELSPYGDWVEVDDYGYCFQPYGTGDDWRPYTDGYWADSDEGWVWVSNEPHGWATYHYGRWVNVTDRGWLWVPGYEWGPGWVSWRESENYVGWAPLPPQVGWAPQNGIRFGDSFGFGDVGPGSYNFIDPRYFGYPRMRDHVFPYDRNVDIIGETMNVTDIASLLLNNRSLIANNGPNRDFLRQRSERPIRWLRIEREDDLTAEQLRNRKMRNQIEGDRYRVVSPKVERVEGARPKKVAGRVTRDQIDDGYGRIPDRRRAEEVRQRIRAQAEDPKNQKGHIAEKAGPGDARKDVNSPNRQADTGRPNEGKPQQRDPDGRPGPGKDTPDRPREQADRERQRGGTKDREVRDTEKKHRESNRPGHSGGPQGEKRPDTPEKPKPRPQQQQKPKPQEKSERQSPKPPGEPPKKQGHSSQNRDGEQASRSKGPEDKPKPQKGKAEQRPKPEKKGQQPKSDKSGGPEKKEERKEKD